MVAAGFFVFSEKGSISEEEFSTGVVKVNGRELKVKIADNERKREEGLQNVPSLDGYDGMLFVFEKSAPVSFWNKNTFLNLDIIWIENNKIIGISYLPKIGTDGIRIVDSPGPVGAVLEIPSGNIDSLSELVGASVSSPRGLK
ncbi:DUF192 domain-containing protein [Candidatus Giovannonibacteria bacterium]|nr:DUF192 domain-containing protein [Candidatus Giovannonibacteria bacterium]